MDYNDEYLHYIVHKGKQYRYDPDYDCFYRVYSSSELTHWQTYGWIYTITILAALAFYIEFLA